MHWLVHTWLDCSLVHCRKALQCTRKDQMIYYVVDMMNVLWNPPAWILMAFRPSFQNAIRMSSISFRYNLWIYISIAADIICLQGYLLWLEPSPLILKISNAWLLPSTAIWSPLVICKMLGYPITQILTLSTPTMMPQSLQPWDTSHKTIPWPSCHHWWAHPHL